jgi:AraC-like DNA-binding protein
MSWELVSRRPHPALRAHIRRYAGYTEAGTGPVRRREPISGDVVLIIAWGPPMRIAWPLEPRDPGGVWDSFLVGMHAPVTITEHEGVAAGVQVDLTPLGGRMLLGTPMHEVAGRLVRLDEALGPLGAELPERMAAARTWDERFAVLDALLGERMLAAASPPPDVAYAWERLTSSGGRLAVEALAAEMGCSRRHLAARFREHVGVSPKAAARVIRFHTAVRRLSAGGAGWADIAVDCGYYDQPHLNRDFREFAGITPAQLEARLRGDLLGIAA